LVHFVVILVYIFRFGMLCQDKSGNPATEWLAKFRLGSPMHQELSRELDICACIAKLQDSVFASKLTPDLAAV
jgi:hypothetical protein